MTATTTPIETLNPPLGEGVRLANRLRAAGIALSVRRSRGSQGTGSFVRVVELAPGRFLLALGTASARGVQAERLAVRVGEHLEEHAESFRDLGALVASANELLYRSGGGEHLVKLLLVLVDGRSRTVRVANAGHDVPLFSGRSGAVVSLRERGPALGLLPGVRYRESGLLRMPKDMVLLAASRGVAESADAEGRTFGRDRVGAILSEERARGPRAVVRRLLREAREHGAEPEERLALAVRFRG